ncbi:FHA domain-containing protein [Sporomusa aerivorans]|uniref:FHA domain-containing protein n=1 Tax=Sporomusa aerivorans TaxID=204936 RepID=UPI00352B3D0E
MVTQFIIEKGLPYEEGARIEVSKRQIVLGRVSHTEKPDIIFESKFISRKHCLLSVNETSITLTDLNSKHGTLINKQQAVAGQPIELNANDRIILAQGAAVLRLAIRQELNDETLDLSHTAFDFPQLSPCQKKIKLDIARRQCLVNNTKIPLSPKEWQLLLLLYANSNQTVYHDKIRCNVWPERNISGGEIPTVGLDEINLLIYRLRHKLGVYGSLIKNIRGVGCVLEL